MLFLGHHLESVSFVVILENVTQGLILLGSNFIVGCLKILHISHQYLFYSEFEIAGCEYFLKKNG